MLESAWWRAWGANLEGGRIPEATLAAMRAQPRFPDAVARAVRDVLRLADDDDEFARTTQDLESLMLVTIVLYLDATGDLTHRRLREVAGVRGFLSGSRISALLMRMQMIGYVRAEGGHAPGTAKIYRPTPRLIAAYRAWARAMLEAVEVMAPEPTGLGLRLDEPETFRAFMAVGGKRFLDGVSSPSVQPGPASLEAFAAVGTHRAGHLVLFVLLEAAAAEAGHFPASGPVSLSISALARRGRVSRSQVFRILRHAEQVGLFRRNAGEEAGEVRPALVDGVEAFYAYAFTNTAAAAYGALGGGALTSR